VVVVNMDSLIPGLIGLSLFTVPTVCLTRLIWLARSSRSWPVAEGRIISSWIEKKKRGRGGMSGLGAFNYRPRVRYTYQVDGQTATGTTIFFGQCLNTNEADAKAILRSYPADLDVQVKYHPGRPNLATLQTRASGRVYLFLVLALAMMGAILCGILSAV
jgi:hypothetical protein